MVGDGRSVSCVNMVHNSGRQKVGDERKRVTIFLGDSVEPSKVDAEAEASILFLDEKDRCSVRGRARTDESCSEVFLDEVSERLQFYLRERIHWGHRRRRPFLEIYFQIIWSVRGEVEGLGLTEHISKVSVLFGDLREIRSLFGDGGRIAGDGGVGGANAITLRSRYFTGTREGGCTYYGDTWGGFGGSRSLGRDGGVLRR